MFKFIGGVTRYIVPDNCKTAVTKADKYDPLVNKTYHDMCVHYNIAVDPADSYSPRHKPNVEKAVHIIQQDFLPRIRNKTYTSLVELNRDLKS
jgi:transposase